MTLPLVSVIVPAYNQEDLIAETLDSLISQDYDNLQIVVRDDGSKDSTPEILQSYGQRYPGRVMVLEGDGNLGIAGNCNRLLDACEGKYIAVFAGDDVALPRKIRLQVERMESDERCVLCHHDVDVFNSETGESLYLYSARHQLRGGSAAELVKYPAFCAGSSVMVRRDAIPAGGYDGRIRYASDWLFFIETLLSRGVDNPGAGMIPGVLARYRRHQRNVTHNAVSYGLDESLVAYGILQQREPSLRAAIRLAKAERLATYGFRQILSYRFVEGSRNVVLGLRLSPVSMLRVLTNALRYYATARRDVRPAA